MSNGLQALSAGDVSADQSRKWGKDVGQQACKENFQDMTGPIMLQDSGPRIIVVSRELRRVAVGGVR